MRDLTYTSPIPPQRSHNMLDVHPPHHAASTWRDFFIHIATIVVGLLIAIALEQTVEAIHRARERKVLIEDIHTEAEHNLHVFDDNIAQNNQVKAWAKVSIAAIDAASPQSSSSETRGRNRITVALPAGKLVPNDHAPSRAVWSVAKANGKVALLPENLAEVYDRVDYDAERFMQAREDRDKLLIDIRAFETRFGVAIRPGATLQLPPAALDELSRMLGQYAASCTAVNDWTSWWAGAADAVLHDVQSRDDMVPYLDQHHASLPQ